MKKANPESEDEMRSEYVRSDFGTLTRGKHYQQIMESSNVVVLNPEVAKAFPNSAAVNDVLSQLLTLAKSATQLKPRSIRPSRKG